MKEKKKLICRGSCRFRQRPCRPGLPASRPLPLLRLCCLDVSLVLALLLADAGHVGDDLGDAAHGLGAAFAKDQPLPDLQIFRVLDEPEKSADFYNRRLVDTMRSGS